MKIETFNHLSLCISNKTFFRVESVSGENGVEIIPVDYNCYWAFVDMSENEFRIVAFPERSWFEDWIKAQPNKVKIIQEQGIVKVEK